MDGGLGEEKNKTIALYDSLAVVCSFLSSGSSNIGWMEKVSTINSTFDLQSTGRIGLFNHCHYRTFVNNNNIIAFSSNVIHIEIINWFTESDECIIFFSIQTVINSNIGLSVNC